MTFVELLMKGGSSPYLKAAWMTRIKTSIITNLV